jgi:cytochrome d ubiquinol oxidase subunit II
MLIGLIVRGVAFEFRAKVRPERKAAWDWAFFAGSLATALAQGCMLGLYVMGLEITPATVAFSALTAVCLAAGYVFIGACWLIIKTDGDLQRRSVRWARRCLVFIALGLGSVSVASPLVSPRIFEKWFSLPEIVLLAPLPIASVVTIGLLWIALKNLPDHQDRWAWLPFFGAVTVFALAFTGLAYSFYPYVVPDRLTIYDAASAPESLLIILIGALLVVPVIITYSLIAYRIFRGKATVLRYD